MRSLFHICLRRQYILVQEVLNENSWNQKWQGQDNNMHDELSRNVPHSAIRGKKIISNQTSKANRTGAFYSYLTEPIMRVLCGRKETNDSRANINEQSHENETIKNTKNCPSCANGRPIDFAHLDARLLTVSLYPGIAQFAKRRSCRAKNSLRILTGRQLAVKVLAN